MMQISNQSMLNDMNRLANEANLSLSGSESSEYSDKTSFGSLITNAISDVNNKQVEATQAKYDVITEKPGASVANMVAKASEAQVSLAATIELRNKMLEAYSTLSNMPI